MEDEAGAVFTITPLSVSRPMGSWWPKALAGSDLIGILRRERVATQKRNGEHQNEHEQPQQAELNHRGSENTGTVVRPHSFLRERSHFQADYQDAPNRSDQANDEEGFA
jgi:hypothetical protein